MADLYYNLVTSKYTRRSWKIGISLLPIQDKHPVVFAFTDSASVCVCVLFLYLVDAVSSIYPESCQPLMKARAWLVQCYSWDPEELDLLGRNQT